MLRSSGEIDIGFVGLGPVQVTTAVSAKPPWVRISAAAPTWRETQDRDRFAREPAYHYLLRREFEEHGAKIRAMNDRGDDSPEGELTDGILDQLAKFERAKTADRSRRGKLRKVSKDKVIAIHTPNYGFRYNATRDS